MDTIPRQSRTLQEMKKTCVVLIKNSQNKINEHIKVDVTDFSSIIEYDRDVHPCCLYNNTRARQEHMKNSYKIQNKIKQLKHLHKHDQNSISNEMLTSMRNIYTRTFLFHRKD